MKIKVGDKVVVIAGKHKGTQATVKKTLRKTDRVILDGVNMVTKSLKPSQANPEGGKVQFEASIHTSNVALTSKTKVKVKKATNKKAISKKSTAKKTKTTKKALAKKATAKK